MSGHVTFGLFPQLDFSALSAEMFTLQTRFATHGLRRARIGQKGRRTEERELAVHSGVARSVADHSSSVSQENAPIVCVAWMFRYVVAVLGAHVEAVLLC